MSRTELNGSVLDAERRCRRSVNHPVGWRVKPRDARLLHFVMALAGCPATRRDGMACYRRKHSFRPWQGPERATGTGPPQPTSRLVTPARRTSASSIPSTHRIVEGVTTVNKAARRRAVRRTKWEIEEGDHEDTDELIEREDGQPKM